MSAPIAANDSTHVPPLDEHVRARLRRAYDRTELARNDITFDKALADDCIRLALRNLADTLERREPPAWARTYDETELGI